MDLDYCGCNVHLDFSESAIVGIECRLGWRTVLVNELPFRDVIRQPPLFFS